ncbi:MAG: Ldh family oxidoreductase, partial [Planctomycetota bacterium]
MRTRPATVLGLLFLAACATSETSVPDVPPVVSVERNLWYVPDIDAGDRRRLDLYVPEGEGPFPVLLWIHGGAWAVGHRKDEEPLARRFAEQGIAVLLTRNHGHFGAAGLYSRLTLPHDLLCFVTSGHQLALAPGKPVYSSAGGSPMSFSAPAGSEDPLVLDFGAMHDL